jgi:hypothetical protein
MVRLGSKPLDQALSEAVQRAKAETDATDQLAELQREAPDLAALVAEEQLKLPVAGRARRTAPRGRNDGRVALSPGPRSA